MEGIDGNIKKAVGQIHQDSKVGLLVIWDAFLS